MWEIKTTDMFDEWFSRLEDTDRASVLASLIVLREKGQTLCRHGKGIALQQHEGTTRAKPRHTDTGILCL